MGFQYIKTLASLDIPQLEREINAEPTLADNGLNYTEWKAPSTLLLDFTTELTGPEESTLDGVISAHVPVDKNAGLSVEIYDGIPLMLGRVNDKNLIKILSTGGIILGSYDAMAGSELVRVDGSMLIEGGVDANNQRVSNIATPTAPADAATKSYVDGLISADTDLFYINMARNSASGGSLVVNVTSDATANYRTVIFNKSWLSGSWECRLIVRARVQSSTKNVWFSVYQDDMEQASWLKIASSEITITGDELWHLLKSGDFYADIPSGDVCLNVWARSDTSSPTQCGEIDTNDLMMLEFKKVG